MYWLNMILQDLLVEILLRLPVKTLARCLCVSKLWASIIRSRRFIESYQSTREPYVMFAFRDMFISHRWHFLTPSQSPSLRTNAVRCFDTSGFRMPDCVNGLICVQFKRRLRICNPITGKGIRLPPCTRKPFRAWFMGYDPINYQYKVLFLSKECIRCPYNTVELFTLLGDQGSWRGVDDGNIIHTPATRGICIGGVVYYGADMADEPRIVRFDVRSEKFGKTIEIPAEARSINLGLLKPLNYQGKLALLATQTISIYDLWVLEDAEKQEWSRVSLVITREMCPFDIILPGLVGFVAGSGELIVTARSSDHYHVVYVDLKKKRSREVWLKGSGSYLSSSLVLAFPDFVESIILM